MISEDKLKEQFAEREENLAKMNEALEKCNEQISQLSRNREQLVKNIIATQGALDQLKLLSGKPEVEVEAPAKSVQKRVKA